MGPTRGARGAPSLFDPPGGAGPDAPLAVRMRPRDLDELVGQQHLVGPGSPLRRLLEGGGAPTSLILWGPPGTGKTTLAGLVSAAAGRRFVELSAVTAGVRDVRAVVDTARDERAALGRGTVLFIDEVHRFTRTQQDALLPAVENGWVTLVAATTENPSFTVVAPLLSRSLVLTLEPLADDDVRAVLRRAAADPRGLGGRVALAAGAEDLVVRVAQGDARRALTALEAAAAAAAERPDGRHGSDGPDGTAGSGGSDGAAAVVGAADVERAVQTVAVRYDRDGDQHYDVVSAFIKSVRGSDADAALHYLARMVEAGEDPRFVARRLLVLASEDVGLADPTALQAAVAALHAVAHVGLPEARLVLAQATLHLALAPKSNAVARAMDAAQADVRAGLGGPVPAHLRDAHYPGAARYGHGAGYAYPHDRPGGVAAQDYAPADVRARRYYAPAGHGAEARWAQVHERLRAVVRGGADAGPGAPPGLGSGAPEERS